MWKEKTKIFQQDAMNQIEFNDLLLTISPDIELYGKKEKGSEEVEITVRYPEEFENEIRDLVQNYVQTKTEEESLEENATTPTDRFKKLFINTLQNLDAQERAKFKEFIEGL